MKCKSNSSNSSTATHRMVTRYGGSKTSPREIVGAVYHTDPNNWSEAMASPDGDKWCAATESERFTGRQQYLGAGRANAGRAATAHHVGL
ncbi:hypothetical protein DVH05_027358 [Phytophthora capsici]|nr:hypothetical protein DVH05_027358 [Phytophthora capsici]